MMNATWSLIPIFLVIALAIIVGIRRHRRFRINEQRHIQLARLLGLKRAYVSPSDFTLFGQFQGFDLRVEPQLVQTRGEQSYFEIVKTAIPMVNPNLKILAISKGIREVPAMQQLIQLDKPVHIPHQIGDWLSITTNDMFFSSIILTDDIKISIYKLFSRLDQGLLYIQDEELAFVLPGYITQDAQVNAIHLAAQLMVDIKEELA